MYAMTAAHRSLPLGTWVVVTDLSTGRSVRVRINDRGPYVDDRIIDLSYAAAKALGVVERGTAEVEIRCPFAERKLREELGYWVQLGAYTSEERAARMVLDLQAKYPSARVFSSDSIHHVRIGPFRSEEEARRTSRQLIAAGRKAYVVRDLLALSCGTSPLDAPLTGTKARYDR